MGGDCRHLEEIKKNNNVSWDPKSDPETEYNISKKLITFE